MLELDWAFSGNQTFMFWPCFHFHIQEKENCPETQKHQQTIVVKATITVGNESAVELIHIDAIMPYSNVILRWLN